MTDTETATDCIFCRIARGELGTEFVAESPHAVAFRDIAPQAPTHVLIVPRRHITGLPALTEADAPLVGEMLMLANEVAQREGLSGGYRVLTNVGPDAGQTVDHLHFHVLGGRQLGALG